MKLLKTGFGLVVAMGMSQLAQAYQQSCVSDQVRQVNCKFKYPAYGSEEEGRLSIRHVLSVRQNEASAKKCLNPGPVESPVEVRLSNGFGQSSHLPVATLVEDLKKGAFTVSFQSTSGTGREGQISEFSSVSVSFQEDSAQPVNFVIDQMRFGASLTCLADDDSIVSPKQIRIVGDEAKNAYKALIGVPETQVLGQRALTKRGRSIECTVQLSEDMRPIDYSCKLQAASCKSMRPEFRNRRTP